MRQLIEMIIQEFKEPFKDPRELRSDKRDMSIEKLFYLLIDETPRTFKKGLVVTATVTRVLETRAICRLENGLTAVVHKIATGEDCLATGHIVTGRIDKIITDSE